MKKSFFKLILSAFALMFVCSANAQQVTREGALQKAQAFLSKDASNHQSIRRAPRQAPKLVLANDRDELFVFNDEANGGYVVISGDERMPDVLGYSYDGHYDADNLPCNMKAWLEGYAEQVKYLQGHPEVNISSRKEVNRGPISPLLTCIWSQGEPWNLECPIIGNEHCLTGCVATAMAMIMYYYKWPHQTSGVIPGFITESKKIVIPDMSVTTIDWANMVDEYSAGNYTQQQAIAVATLMKLCGAAVKMNYDTWGSGSIDGRALEAFLNYFDYDDALMCLYRDWFDVDEWDQIIYDELYNGRPVYYGGYGADGGHSMVVDGYSADGFFHVNFGWASAYNPDSPDGYYLFTGPLWGFSGGQRAFINLKPSSPDSPKEYAIRENEKLTFYYDMNMDIRSGEVIPHLRHFLNHGVTECEFDTSFANFKLYDLEAFFSYSKDLKTIRGLGNLNTSNAFSMRQMFEGCSSLTEADVSHFNTSRVRDMTGVFEDCSSLKRLDLSQWHTSNVTDMVGMFERCRSLEELNIKGLDTSNLTDMNRMFSGCESLKSLDISSFKTDKVEYMDGLFNGLSKISSLDISHFNTSNVKDMSYMFSYCWNLESLDLSHFKTENVANMEGMFAHCYQLEDLDISSFNTSKVQGMSNMFWVCKTLTHLDLSRFNTDNVTSMKGMFSGCEALKNLDLKSFNTSKVTDMAEMFYDCSSLEKLDLDGFNTENVTNMRTMFFSCKKMEDIDLSRFNTKNVTNMQSMFCSNQSLKSLDLSNFDTSNVTDMGSMFGYCKSLTSIYVSEGWENDKVENAEWMFYGCDKLIGGKGTTYDENHIGLDYAHIDGGLENPGYFTYKESTGILLPITEEEAVCPAVYSLSGIKVRAEGKGIDGLPGGVYIVGGKKVVVK